MLGNDDLGPEPQPRAPGLSIEEMLRRAREARLGDTPPTTLADVPSPRFVPLTTTARPVASRWLHSCTVLVLGILLGVFATYSAIHTSVSPASTPPVITSQSTPGATLFAPTATDTPVPTPTVVLSPTPTAASYLTADDIVSLAQRYYDSQSVFAGTYILVDATAVQIDSQDHAQLTACIAYEYAAATAPDTIAGDDVRLFTFSQANDGTWQVVQMDDSASCSLS